MKIIRWVREYGDTVLFGVVCISFSFILLSFALVITAEAFIHVMELWQ